MARRLELQTLLETIAPKVYFQPPSNVQMEYPCIRYERDAGDTLFADNKPYRFKQRYQVTVITRDPDSDLKDQVAALPESSYERYYPANNLHHDVFNVYF